MKFQVVRIFQLSSSYTTLLLGVWCVLSLSSHLQAKPPAISSTSTVPLQEVQKVLVETLALTERGLQDSTPIQKIVMERIAHVGFTPVSDANIPHDILLRVKCEEQKTKTGPSKHRKGSHPSAAASRLWNGPACHISYRYQNKPALWSWEVRTPFEDSRQAAKASGAKNSGLYALQALQNELAKNEFPLYLTAEWGQTERLIHLFQEETDHLDRRRLILQLLGPLTSPTALSTLEEATKNPDLTVTALAALGDQGEVAIPSLVNLLNSSENSDHRLATLKALGEIATHSTPTVLYDVFIKQLDSPNPRMQTIAVRGLGSLGDLRAIASIENLNTKAWSNPSTHADMEALRETLNWALYQLDPSSSSH